MRHFFILFMLFSSSLTFSQSLSIGPLISDFNRNGEIEGVVYDGENENEPLFFAEVTVKETNTTTETAIDGSFKLSLKPGNYTLVISFIGYKSVEIKNINVTANNTLQLAQVLNTIKLEQPNSQSIIITKAS